MESESNTFYKEIVIDHNLHPGHKHKLENPDLILEGVNPSCGDDLILQLKVKDGVVTDGAYVGDGCAISQASADMMLDLIIGKTVEEARHYADIFMRMIKGKVTDEELDELEESASLQDISHMPSRVKCAVLGWRTMDEMLEKGSGEDGDGGNAGDTGNSGEAADSGTAGKMGVSSENA